MRTNKPTYNQRSRKDISNPFHKEDHKSLLTQANIDTFPNGYSVKKLANGKIQVVGKSRKT
jgi:hypothetical protein